MRTKLAGQVAEVRAAVPEGCRACRGWPLVRFLVDGDPEPASVCTRCGRRWHGLTRVFVMERVEPTDSGG